MILRIDRLQTELPPPSDPDPVGAAAVQELLGGKFGEMSTFMNYTYQSFNFRNRQGARPFYDLVASIAAEEFGHIELVSAAINTMLTGAAEGEPGAAGALDSRQGHAQHPAVHRRRRRRAGPGLQRQAVERRLRLLLRRPRRGPHAQLLPRDRRAQQQAQGLRDGRPPRRPRADRLPARPRRRPPGRLRARPGEPHRAPTSRSSSRARGSRPTRSPSASRTSSAASTSSSTASRRSDFQEIAAVFNGPHPETGEELAGRRGDPARGRPGLRPPAAAGGVRPRPRARGDRRDRGQAAQGRRPAQGADRRRRQQRRQRRR